MFSTSKSQCPQHIIHTEHASSTATLTIVAPFDSTLFSCIVYCEEIVFHTVLGEGGSPRSRLSLTTPHRAPQHQYFVTKLGTMVCFPNIHFIIFYNFDKYVPNLYPGLLCLHPLHLLPLPHSRTQFIFPCCHQRSPTTVTSCYPETLNPRV
jgi:hypothetical protein